MREYYNTSSLPAFWIAYSQQGPFLLHTSSWSSGLRVEVVNFRLQSFQRAVCDRVDVPASPSRPSRRAFLRWRFSCVNKNEVAVQQYYFGFIAADRL